MLRLTWADNATNEEGFSIEYSLDKVTFQNLMSVGANITSFNVGIVPYNLYFRVFAYNQAGKWGNSNVVYVDITPPTKPLVTDGGMYTSNAASLYAKWISSDADSGIGGYQYQITQDSTTGTVIKAWVSTGTTASVTAAGLTLL